MKRNYLIAISGGPCAGKSTIIARLKKDLPYLRIMKEVATDLLEKGAERGPELQKKIIEEQTSREDEMIWGVCDRSIADAYSYGGFDPQEIPMYPFRYRQVYFIRSRAVIAPEEYLEKRKNNEVRIESLKEAIAQDRATLLMNGWVLTRTHLNVLEGKVEKNYAEVKHMVEVCFRYHMLLEEYNDPRRVINKIISNKFKWDVDNELLHLIDALEVIQPTKEAWGSLKEHLDGEAFEHFSRYERGVAANKCREYMAL